MEHKPTKGLYGWITHTEFASTDPEATRKWCASVLGWNFKPGFPTPSGNYHLFSYADKGGGGIRSTNLTEIPGSTPFVHVENTVRAYEEALKEGADEVLVPTQAMNGVTIAIVRAPGGVHIGFSGP